jgi:hypothetical protein
MEILLHELKETVRAFRRQIEPAWSETTAYKIPEITQYGPYNSGGQCAVTCLVLMDVLGEKYPNLKIYLVSGQLKRGEKVSIVTHNWLRVGNGSQAVIIDPTVDQALEVKDKVLVDTIKNLESQKIYYVESEVEEDQGQQLHPKRFSRYVLLKEALRKFPKEAYG